MLRICELREQALRDHGFDDAYRIVKAAENDAAIAMVEALLAELDAMPPLPRLEALLQGIFAGNIFDLVALTAVTINQFDMHFSASGPATRSAAAES